MLLLKKIATMLLMVFVGYGLVKGKLLKSDQSVVLSTIVMYAVFPCLILDSFQLEYSGELLTGLGIAFVGAVVVHIIFILGTKPVGKLLKLDNVDRASLIFTNGGNLIVPLVSSMLGREYVFYCCAFVVVQTVMVWVYLPGMLNDNYKVSIKKILLNTNILAIEAGLICFFGRITLPPILADTVKALSDSVGPLCMLIIGMLMADVDLKHIFTDPHSYLICFLRLIAYPLAVILVIWLTRITSIMPASRDTLVVTVLAAAAPIGVAVAQMATLFGGDARRAGAINVMSVLLCIITMPLMMLIYQTIC